MRGESPALAQTFTSEREVSRDVSQSRQYSLPLYVRFVVSTVALCAVLQPGEGEPGPEECLYNIIIIIMISLYVPGAHGHAGPGAVLRPPGPHEAAQQPGPGPVLVTAEYFPTAEN